jgi:hypothetical protein
MSQAATGMIQVELARKEFEPRAGLYLRFACGHLAKLVNPQSAHEWLVRAGQVLCSQCERAKDAK